jgi:hypothetical protein
MRHSDMRLTMNVYTDPRLLDIAGAVDVLPMLSIDATSAPVAISVIKATGTESGCSSVAPMVAPTGVVSVQKWSISGNSKGDEKRSQKTKKPLESLEKPRVFVNRAGGIRTHDLYHPKVKAG